MLQGLHEIHSLEQSLFVLDKIDALIDSAGDLAMRPAFNQVEKQAHYVLTHRTRWKTFVPVIHFMEAIADIINGLCIS